VVLDIVDEDLLGAVAQNVLVVLKEGGPASLLDVDWAVLLNDGSIVENFEFSAIEFLDLELSTLEVLIVLDEAWNSAIGHESAIIMSNAAIFVYPEDLSFVGSSVVIGDLLLKSFESSILDNGFRSIFGGAVTVVVDSVFHSIDFSFIVDVGP